MSSTYELQKTQRVNEWFERHTCYDRSPKTYVEQIVTNFIDVTRRLNLTLCISHAQFYRAISRLICQMYYHKGKPNITQYLEPTSKLPKPRDWKPEYEQQWFEYMDYHYFDCDFWERFWNHIPECHMDSTLYNWRTVLTMRLPHFITRDLSILMDDEGYMFDDEDADDYYAEDNEYVESS